MKRHLTVATAFACLPLCSAAHEGHGLTGAHWHATDLWGFVALGAVAALAVWLRRRK
ncbi:hypothetical protein [Piscinibacter sp. XHJ-5]|uniref:hypothetical protein n=1 Tax=Piscinibacter sp. XHJ-5 TaxID=3037797 RepID=UPI002452CAF8|nr:hypothetical protein [Piscinibacter sp. XHJ-5]